MPAGVRHFTGRVAELSALGRLLDAEADTVVISAIGGMAGVGKTALALAVTAARAAARPGFPLAAQASELRDAAGRLDALDAGDAASSVRAVFSWSCRYLTRPAARMFGLLGLHPGPDICVAAAASLAAAGPAEVLPGAEDSDEGGAGLADVGVR